MSGYEWIRRVRQTIPAGHLKTRFGDWSIWIAQALVLVYGVLAVLYPEMRVREFIGGLFSEGRLMSREFLLFALPLGLSLLLAGASLLLCLNRRPDAAERVRLIAFVDPMSDAELPSDLERAVEAGHRRTVEVVAFGRLEPEPLAVETHRRVDVADAPRQLDCATHLRVVEYVGAMLPGETHGLGEPARRQLELDDAQLTFEMIAQRHVVDVDDIDQLGELRIELTDRRVVPFADSFQQVGKHFA